MQVKTGYETLFDSMYSLFLSRSAIRNIPLLNLTMDQSDNREVWQRGPIPGVAGLLQPVAHALLQASEEIARYAKELPPALLWQRPAGVASVGFHLLHMRGVVDRLFTYARGEALTPGQLKNLSAEQEPGGSGLAVDELVDGFHTQVEKALGQLRSTDPAILLHVRTIGRKQIPSTVMGLLFHAAEHTQRHLGQLLVTVRVQTK
jgi:uncharacterized damage-inducible protein DinB